MNKDIDILDDNKLTISKEKSQSLFDHDFTQESTDMIKFIDWNERRHRIDAQSYLKRNSSLTF